VVATITDAAIPYAEEVQKELRASGIRAELDVRNEKINYKVREHSVNKVPLMLVVGAKEAEQKSVSIRRLGSEKQETMALTDAKTMLMAECQPPA